MILDELWAEWGDKRVTQITGGCITYVVVGVGYEKNEPVIICDMENCAIGDNYTGPEIPSQFKIIGDLNNELMLGPWILKRGNTKMSLPEFESVNRCPKCGQRRNVKGMIDSRGMWVYRGRLVYEFKVEWVDTLYSVIDKQKMANDRLQVTCPRCGHLWEEQTWKDDRGCGVKTGELSIATER